MQNRQIYTDSKLVAATFGGGSDGDIRMRLQKFRRMKMLSNWVAVMLVQSGENSQESTIYLK